MLQLFDVKNILMTLIGVANLLLSFYIASRNWRDEVNRMFSAVGVAIAIWTVAAVLFRTAGETTAFRSAKILYAGATFMPTVFLYFTAIFPPIEVRKNLLRIALPVVNIAAIAFVFTSGLINSIAVRPGSDTIITFGPGYVVYAAYYFILFGFSYYFLFRKYWQAEGIVRVQLRFLLIGTLLTTIVGLFTNLVLPWFGVFTYYIWMGQISTFILVGFIAYAIVKHQLLNVRVITTEIFAVALSFILLVRLLLSSSWIEWLINGLVFVGVAVFNVLLIRSVLREVSQREKIETLAGELAVANEELKKLDAAKSEFISLASHQLRAPLTVIKGYVSMLLEGTLGPTNALTRESMKKVGISAEQLVRLVGDLLDLSRIETGRLRYDKKPMALDAVVAEVVAEVKPSAEQKGLKIRLITSDRGAQPVNADADKIREVVMNLIDNAIKYTATGEIRVELLTERRGGHPWVVYRVTDSGIGVKSEDIPRLFTKFSRTDEARRIRADGMGLGLYLVKRIVEDHGGEVSVTSPGVGEGSTFAVALPGLNPREVLPSNTSYGTNNRQLGQ